MRHRWRSWASISEQPGTPLVRNDSDGAVCVAAVIMKAFCDAAERHLLPCTVRSRCCSHSRWTCSHALSFLEMAPWKLPLGLSQMTGSFGRIAGDLRTAFDMAHQNTMRLAGSEGQGYISHNGLVVEHVLARRRRDEHPAKTRIPADCLGSRLDLGMMVASPC